MAEVSSLLQRAGIVRNRMSMLIGEDDLRSLAFACCLRDGVLGGVAARSPSLPYLWGIRNILLLRCLLIHHDLFDLEEFLY
jgi:hypothetical protein